MYQHFSPFHDWIKYHCTFVLSIHQLMDIWCFHFFAVMNDTTTTIHVQVFVGTYVFNSLGYIPRSGIAELYSISMFNFWGMTKLFFLMITNFLFLPVSIWKFQFFHILHILHIFHIHNNSCYYWFFVCL